MSKNISIDDDVLQILETAARKDENGRREETYSSIIKRLLKVK